MEPKTAPAGGALTFLFTDIEGSTGLWAEQPAAMDQALRRHDELLHRVIALHLGTVFKTVGDSFHATFADPRQALAAAIEAEQAFEAQDQGKRDSSALALRVRMALHTGLAEFRDGDWYGTTVNNVARLLEAAHGGQILVSDVCARLLADHLPDGVALIPLGAHRLRGAGCVMPMLQVTVSGLRSSFPPLRIAPARLDNLPAEATSLIGREAILPSVCAAVTGERLVTLTGIGGTGKTRLALRAAALLRDTFRDGVWLVELGPLSRGELVAAAVAGALGVSETARQPTTEAVLDYLSGRETLLVLDNCEHVLGAAADLASRVLGSAGGVRMLATSREPLGVAGEVTWPVPPLAVTPDATDGDATGPGHAVQLFLDRAVAVRPDLELAPEDLAAAAKVCRRLDGVPLAIELAAARTRSLTVAEIADRLDDRFRLLRGGSRTAAPRQHTLLAAMDWSHDLLSGPEQALFRRLATFQGGWFLTAAEAVCAWGEVEAAEVLDLVDRLVAKSLIQVESAAGRSRYRFLETVRYYALERLEAAGEVEAARGRHTGHYACVAQAATEGLRGPDQVSWLADLDLDRDNMRAAIAWSLQGDGAQALCIAAGLARYWLVRGLWREGRAHLGAALAAADGAASGEHATALNAAGRLAWVMGDLGTAESLHRQALDESRSAGDARAEGASLGQLGNVAILRGDLQAARSLHERALDVQEAAGDRFEMVDSLNSLGNVLLRQGEFDGALAIHERSLALAREIGALRAMASSHNNMGLAHHQRGDLARAEAQYEQGLVVTRQLQDRLGVALMLGNLGALAFDRGDLARSLELCTESLEVRREAGEARGTGILLINLAHLRTKVGQFDAARSLLAEAIDLCAAHDMLPELLDAAQAAGELAVVEGRLAPAVRLLAAVDAIRAGRGLPLEPRRAPDARQTLTAARDGLADSEYRSLWAEGMALSESEAVDLARSVVVQPTR